VAGPAEFYAPAHRNTISQISMIHHQFIWYWHWANQSYYSL